MIWNICYAISLVAICASFLLFIRQYKWKKANFSSAVKTLIIGFAIGLFTMLLPIQLDAFSDDAVGVPKAILTAINTTLRAFFLTDINFMHQGLSIDKGLYAVYSFTLMLLCFVCPLLTVSYIMSFFSKIRAGVKRLLSRNKNLYVFSQMNENSLALARDLYRNQPKRRIIFCDVSDAFKSQNSHMLTEADRIGAICFSKDIRSLSFRFHSKKKSLWFFTIGKDEQQNTNDALALLALYKERKNTRIYLFSALPESHMILSAIDPGVVKVRRVDKTRSLINRFLYDNGDLLFRSAADLGDGSKTISAVIVGLGGCGKELLKALTWYCQMDGYRLMIDAFDLDAEVADYLAAECPDLLNPMYNGTFTEGEAEYHIRIHSQTDVRSASFLEQLQKLNHPTFAFVSLGDDSDNIEISAMLRMQFERMGVKPIIYTVLKNSDKKRMIEDIENFKGQKYDIHSIGDIHSTFSEKEIINSELEEEALRLHQKWGDEESFWRYEYHYQSSLARAIHLQARRSLYGADSNPNQSITEHRRWNAYMRSQGYIYSGSSKPSSRNDLAKVHNDLIPYHQLSVSEKQKDNDD